MKFIYEINKHSFLGLNSLFFWAAERISNL